MLTVEILQVQNKRLREENEELVETVRQYREAEAAASILPAGLPHLTRLEEKALKAIWIRRGIVDKLTIYSAIYGDETTVDLKIVDVAIHKLRRKLTAPWHPKIVTHWARGYSIEGREASAGNAAVERSDIASMIADELAA